MALQLTDAQLEMVVELRDKRASVSSLQRDIDEIRDSLLASLRDADTEHALTSSGAPALHVQTQMRRSVNAAKLEAMYPDVYEDVFEEKPMHVLKVDYE